MGIETEGEVVVVGGGTMGSGIAEVMLTAGASIRLVEPDERAASSVRSRLETNVGENVSRMTVVPKVDTPIDAVLVVEAVPEDASLKKEILADLERVVSPVCVLASNTSSLSINRIAEALEHPERFIGMHFFNPVPRSDLVEIVVGAATDRVTVNSARRWVEHIGKRQIEVSDSPGFATSRLGVAIGLEAIRMLQEGVASAEDIDLGMVLGYKFPIGPLRLTDLVGLDVRLAIADHLWSELGARFQPPELLRSKVRAGELGRKTGRGFFEW